MPKVFTNLQRLAKRCQDCHHFYRCLKNCNAVKNTRLGPLLLIMAPNQAFFVTGPSIKDVGTLFQFLILPSPCLHIFTSIFREFGPLPPKLSTYFMNGPCEKKKLDSSRPQEAQSRKLCSFCPNSKRAAKSISIQSIHSAH